MKQWIALIIVFISLSLSGTLLNGQKTYFTASGLAIKLYSDGHFEFVDSNQFAPFLLNAEKIANNTKSANDVDLRELDKLNELIKEIKQREASSFATYIYLEKTDQIKGSISKRERKIKDDNEEEYRELLDLYDNLLKIPTYDFNKRSKEIGKIEERLNYFSEIEITTTIPESKTIVEESQYIISPKPPVRTVFEIDDSSPYEIIAEKECNIIFSGFDDKLQKSRIETKAGKLFSFTHPKLRNHFKMDDFLVGETAIMKVGKTTYLNLRITLATKDAKRSYGNISEGAITRISLVSGRSILLKNQVRSKGILEPYLGNTIYQAVYILEKEDINTLKRNEIDKVGIMWTTGFEEYEVYDIDFLMGQINCLENNQ